MNDSTFPDKSSVFTTGHKHEPIQEKSIKVKIPRTLWLGNHQTKKRLTNRLTRSCQLSGRLAALR